MLRMGLDIGTGFVKCVSNYGSARFPSVYASRVHGSWTEKRTEAVGGEAQSILSTTGTTAICPIQRGRPDSRYQKAVEMLIRESVRQVCIPARTPAAPDSDTLVLGGHWSTAGNVLGLENPELAFGRNSVRDTDGNGLRAVTVPVALANVPVPDATVTITADGRFAEDAGTIEVQPGGDMTIEVRFVNEHGSDHTILADLISWNFGHQSEDIEIRSGQSETVTFTVQNEAPRMADDPGRANVYLVFGVADIPGTPVYEPDEIRGDRAIKVRIAEPAS